MHQRIVIPITGVTAYCSVNKLENIFQVGPSHSVNFAGLANFSNDREALNEEFGQIPMITVKSDELPPGAESKNRYANVIPLPETRVHLQVKDGNDSLKAYINANFIKVCKVSLPQWDLGRFYLQR